MRIVLTLIGAAVLSTSALAAGYKESKKGDLSGDGLAPTKVVLKAGDNIIDGDSGRPDRDYFWVKVESGHELYRIVLHTATQIGGNSSFVGVQQGKQVTVDPAEPDAGPLLGWTHFTTEDEGSNILPAICEGAGAQGCTPPLAAGNYAFWVQETGVCADCHYRFVFKVRQLAQ
jgi:hypothetical protein